MAMKKNDDKKNVSLNDELDDFLTSKSKKTDKEDTGEKPVENPVKEEVVEEVKVEEPVKVEETPIVEEVKEEPKVIKPEPVEDKKDFLSSLVDDKRPESFQEEQVTKVEKKPFKLNRNMIIGGVVGLVVVIAAVYFLFFAPNMTMPDFEGQTTTEVQTWMRQNSISSSDVIVVEVYNFDYASGEVIDQSIAPNKKFRKGAKITITVSKGADPDESILFPDLKNMTYSEITAWRDENKLLNVKINQVYNDTIEAGGVISYTLGSNVSESEFKRGTSLTIEVSRGKQPVQTVNVTDYTGKTLQELQAWADTNKLKVETKDAYTSDATKAGQIASQSPSSGTVDQGSTITVSVYKHAATMTNLVGGTQVDAQSWCSANGVSCTFIEQYSDTVAPNRVVSQSVKSGSIVEGTSTVNIYVSIGRVDFTTFTGTTITELRAWVEEANSKLAGLNLVEVIVKDGSDVTFEGNIGKVTGTDPSGLSTGDITKISFTSDGKYGILKYGSAITVTFFVAP